MIDSTISSSFLTTAQYSSQQTNASSEQEELGRDAFLQLLTTQLNNQDPLDPMDNEAFVAQLAQFSSVEGIKGMQSSLENMVSGMRQDQMMAGASLVGKKVAVEGGLFEGGNGIKTNASINLENAADAVIVNIYDRTNGNLVFSETLGSQMPGDLKIRWEGISNTGEMAAQGNYLMSASTIINGRQQSIPVTTLSQVKSVKWDPSTQQLSLEVNDGKFVPLSSIARISA
jgi:flagellar basal-body rod modification protein FlgD|tara:strand:- start:1145 stop:1831 length:687 start_codon:yes stop_codon:yes gene_type:complete